MELMKFRIGFPFVIVAATDATRLLAGSSEFGYGCARSSHPLPGWLVRSLTSHLYFEGPCRDFHRAGRSSRPPSSSPHSNDDPRQIRLALVTLRASYTSRADTLKQI